MPICRIFSVRRMTIVPHHDIFNASAIKIPEAMKKLLRGFLFLYVDAATAVECLQLVAHNLFHLRKRL